MNYSDILLVKAVQVCEASELGESIRVTSALCCLTKEYARTCVNLSPNGTTPLLAAIKYNHLQIVKLLVEKYGADVNGRGKVVIRTLNGHLEATPLWYASHEGHTAIVKYLLENKAEIDSSNTYASTPLYAACSTGSVEVVRILLRGGANINIPTSFGLTGFLVASRMGHKETVEVLLDWEVDINQTYWEGITALHESSAEGRIDVVKLLLSRGARNKPDRGGITPHMAAAICGQREVARYYSQHGAISAEDEIKALQILGASIVARDGNLNKAVAIWKQAIQLSANKGIETKNNTSEVRRILRKRELRSVSELTRVEEEKDTIEMRIQAALICDRILGLNRDSASFKYSILLSKAIWDVGMIYTMGLDINKAYQLCYLAISTQSRNARSLTEPMIQCMQRLVKIAEDVRFYDKSIRWQLSVYDLDKIFDIAIYELGREQRRLHNQKTTVSESNTECKERLERMTLVVVKLMALICVYSPNSVEDCLVIETKVRQLANLNPKGPNGRTLLELVSSKDTNELGSPPVDLFPSEKCQNLLLRAGDSSHS